MRLVAFDTSGSWCSIAVGDGERWVEVEQPLGQTHSERLLPMTQALLREIGWSMRELDLVAFGAGPGSFTGVRIACGVAQGLAFGLDRLVVPVGTLEAIAQEAKRRHGATRVRACIDARMGEIYAAAYRANDGVWEEEQEPEVLAPDAMPRTSEAAAWVGVGNGFAAYPHLAGLLGVGSVHADIRPTGRAIGELALQRVARGEAVSANAALPLYVRHRVALTTAEREAGARL